MWGGHDAGEEGGLVGWILRGEGRGRYLYEWGCSCRCVVMID